MYFETTIKRNDDSKGKEVTERFIIKGVALFAEAEAAMLAEFDNKCNVVAIKQSKVLDILNSRMDEEQDIYYATLESFYINESGDEKSSKSDVALFANDMTDAKDKIDSYVKQGLEDMSIFKITKTKFLDVIDYLSVENVEK